MVSIAAFKKMATRFPGITESPHFEKDSFRVGKKIFATLDKKQLQVCLKLSLPEQDLFSSFDKAIIFPVPNKWGQQGWTFIDLKKVPKRMLVAALESAFKATAPAKLVAAWEQQLKEN